MRFNEVLINQYADMTSADLHIDPTPEKNYIIALRTLGVENTSSLLSFDPSSISNQNKQIADRILRPLIESDAPCSLKSYAAILFIELHASSATHNAPTDNFFQDCYNILEKVRKKNPYAGLLLAQYKMKAGHISEAVDFIKHAANYWILNSYTCDRPSMKILDDLLAEPSPLLSSSAMDSLLVVHENLTKQNAQSSHEYAFFLAQTLLRKNRWMEGIYFLIHGCKLVTTTQDLSLQEREILINTIRTFVLPYLSHDYSTTSGKEQTKFSLCSIFVHYFVKTPSYSILLDSLTEKDTDVLKGHVERAENTALTLSPLYSIQTDIMLKTYLAAHRLDSIHTLRDLLESQRNWIENHRADVPYLDFLCGTLSQKAAITRADCKELRKNLQRVEESYWGIHGFIVFMSALIWMLPQGLCSIIVANNTSLLGVMLFLIPTWILMAIALSYPLYKLGKLLCEYISDSCRIILTSHPTKLLGEEIICEKLLREFDNASSKLAKGFSSIENLCQSVDPLEDLPPPYGEPSSGAGALGFR